MVIKLNDIIDEYNMLLKHGKKILEQTSWLKKSVKILERTPSYPLLKFDKNLQLIVFDLFCNPINPTKIAYETNSTSDLIITEANKLISEVNYEANNLWLRVYRSDNDDYYLMTVLQDDVQLSDCVGSATRKTYKSTKEIKKEMITYAPQVIDFLKNNILLKDVKNIKNTYWKNRNHKITEISDNELFFFTQSYRGILFNKKVKSYLYGLSEGVLFDSSYSGIKFKDPEKANMNLDFYHTGLLLKAFINDEFLKNTGLTFTYYSPKAGVPLYVPALATKANIVIKDY